MSAVAFFKRIAAAAVIAAVCGTAWSQSGSATYSVTLIGPASGGSYTAARGLSSTGQVSGHGDTADADAQAWVASGGVFSPIAAAGSMAFANGVNASGNAAGVSFAADLSTFTAFLWTGGALVTIPPLGGINNAATALNDAGIVVGYSESAAGAEQAFRYAGGTLTALGTLPGGTTSRANAINTSGQIAGKSDTASGQTHAFLYSAGVWTDLGVPAGYASSEARAVAGSGSVAGAVSTTNGTQRGFVWTPGGGIAVLGTLTGDSIAHGVNAANVVVGTSGGRAVVWSNGALADLNNTLDASGAGWVLQDAVAINDAGQIAGTGLFNGRQRAFLLTPVKTAGAFASFVKADTATRGNWRGVYGADGFVVIGDQTSNPSYVMPSASGQAQWTWASSTQDTRALQKASNASDRLASTWYGTSPFTIDLNFTDTARHQVALYCLDWDSTRRTQTVDVVDAAGAVLDTRPVASFNGGVYLVWNLSGHAKLRVTWTGGDNAVVSGVFFGGAGQAPPPPGATASFVKLDTTTQGNWRTAYGADGHTVVADQAVNPAYVTPAASGQGQWVWLPSTQEARALQKATNPADRIAATWFGGTFRIDLNFADTAQHQVALYCLDFDSTSRRETIDVLDANGAVLDTRSLTSAFDGGVYLVWNVSGHVVLRVSGTAGANAVVSGLFFGGAGTVTPTASFVKLDTATQGNWRGNYGADGYTVIGDQASNPAYVTPVPAGQSQWIWLASTQDARALQKVSNLSDRIAGTWFANAPFTIDLNFTDNAPHRIALYCVDFDSTTRRQTIDVLDANGNVLDSRPLSASFSGGVYLVWNVSGHVKLRVTWTAGANAVASGLFFR